ncbi:biotin synthase BioB, partial [Agrobacterium tumefaciens]|uniref:biotin synthase BioB n=1 Tax=Agrobacterium tumefaciens TaxID=358 RepID=UPI003BA0166E
MQRAQSVLRDHFDPYEVQLSSLLSIKTGGCPEDCGYCPQSVHHDTTVKAEKLMPLADVLEAARTARDQGATRFCMGAAWKRPKDRDLERVAEMIREVKALGLETCVTLGMLDGAQARSLKTAGLDYYNHNLDTAPTFYGRIVSTRTYQERLDTLAHVSDSGINVCCGGIVGMGESREQRAALIAQLTMLSPQPQSVPINRLVRVAGTPLADAADLDVLEFVRT